MNRAAERQELRAHAPRLLWPDTMSVAVDGHLYVAANQLHRQAKLQGGGDERRKPYMLFRPRLGVRPSCCADSGRRAGRSGRGLALPAIRA